MILSKVLGLKSKFLDHKLAHFPHKQSELAKKVQNALKISYFTLAGDSAAVPWKINHSNFSERGFSDNKLPPPPNRNEKLAINQQCNS